MQSFKKTEIIRKKDPKLIKAKETLIEKLKTALDKEDAIVSVLSSTKSIGNVTKAPLDRFLKDVDASYKHKINQQILGDLLEKAKQDLVKAQMDTVTRQRIHKTLNVIYRNGVIRPRRLPKARNKYHWQIASPFQSWSQIGETGESEIRPNVTCGKVRLHYDNEDEHYVSNTIDIGTVIKRQAGAAKRRPYRFGRSDPEFISRCRGVVGRILRLTQPRVQSHCSSFDNEANRFSMRVFQDRVSRLPEHLNMSVEDIIQLCKKSTTNDDYIRMVEFCEPTIHLNPDGLRRELKDIGRGRRITLMLGDESGSDSEDDTDVVVVPAPRARRRLIMQDISSDDDNNSFASSDEEEEEDPIDLMTRSELQTQGARLRILKQQGGKDYGVNGNSSSVAIRAALKEEREDKPDVPDQSSESEEEEPEVPEQSSESEEEPDELGSMKMAELKDKAAELGLTDEQVAEFGNRSRKDTYIAAIQAKEAGEIDVESEEEEPAKPDVESSSESEEEEPAKPDVESSSESEEEEPAKPDVESSSESEEEEVGLDSMKMSELKDKAKELGLTDEQVSEFGNRSRKDTYISAIRAKEAGEIDVESEEEEPVKPDVEEETDQEEPAKPDVEEETDEEEPAKPESSSESEQEEEGLDSMKMTELKVKAEELGLTDEQVAEFGNRSRKDTYISAIRAKEAGEIDDQSSSESEEEEPAKPDVESSSESEEEEPAKPDVESSSESEEEEPAKPDVESSSESEEEEPTETMAPEEAVIRAEEAARKAEESARQAAASADEVEQKLEELKLSELKEKASELGLTDDQVGDFGNRSRKDTYIAAIRAKEAGEIDSESSSESEEEEPAKPDVESSSESEEEEPAKPDVESSSESEEEEPAKPDVESSSESDEEEEEGLESMKMSELKDKAEELGLTDEQVAEFGNRSRKDTYVAAIRAKEAGEIDDQSSSESEEEQPARPDAESSSESEEEEEEGLESMKMSELKDKAEELGLTDEQVAEFGNRSRKDTYISAIRAKEAGEIDEAIPQTLPKQLSESKPELETRQLSRTQKNLGEGYALESRDSLSALTSDLTNRPYIPSGELTEMVANMTDDWASSEDELNFAEDSEMEEPAEFAASSSANSNESGSLEFAESSAVETDSDNDVLASMTGKTSSGLEFAESSAVDSDSAKEHGSSSGLGWAESSDYD